MTREEKLRLGTEIFDALERQDDAALSSVIAGAIVAHNPKYALAEALIVRGVTRALQTAKGAGGGFFRRLFGWL